MQFNSVVPTSILTCGKENIRFWKIKNNILSANSVVLNNTGRGKTFTTFAIDSIEEESNRPTSRKIKWIYFATACGLIYQINYTTKQLEKVMNIHGTDEIT
jgi:hypothetical protein